MCDALAARILRPGNTGMGRRELMRQLERAIGSQRLCGLRP